MNHEPHSESEHFSPRPGRLRRFGRRVIVRFTKEAPSVNTVHFRQPKGIYGKPRLDRLAEGELRRWEQRRLLPIDHPSGHGAWADPVDLFTLSGRIQHAQEIVLRKEKLSPEDLAPLEILDIAQQFATQNYNGEPVSFFGICRVIGDAGLVAIRNTHTKGTEPYEAACEDMRNSLIAAGELYGLAALDNPFE